MPWGRSFGSGGGQRFGRIVLFTSVFKSLPTITTRHGVAIVPVMDAYPLPAGSLNVSGGPAHSPDSTSAISFFTYSVS